MRAHPLNAFTTSPWTNGSQNHRTGAGFGVRVPLEIRAALFQKHWTHVVLTLDGTDFEVANSPAFWNKCSELRSKHIGEWLIRHSRNRWRRGSPPRITVTHRGRNRFALSLPRR
jgi:hypothetical protein